MKVDTITETAIIHGLAEGFQADGSIATLCGETVASLTPHSGRIAHRRRPAPRQDVPRRRTRKKQGF
jgi:hypothetical protein